MTKPMAVILLLAGGLVAADKDNYQRSKECATQAEKLARQEGLSIVRNHYSQKYNGCFALLVWINNDNDLISIYSLFDAFEHSVLAEEDHNYSKNSHKCTVGKQSYPCAQVEQYVENYLTD